MDAFFDSVLVNAPDPEVRLNRLRLLGGVRDTANRIADFSLVSMASPFKAVHHFRHPGSGAAAFRDPALRRGWVPALRFAAAGMTV